MDRIKVDIVSPYGGKEGGIEDVIRAWSRCLNPDLFDLRIMHMTPGIAYLEGYPKAYFINADDENVDASHCASGYNLLIEQFGAPDICIATNTPFMSLACDTVRKYRGIDMVIFSWVHNEIEKYHRAGQGGIREMLAADYHLVLNRQMEKELLEADPSAKVFNIGNPILHEIPKLTDTVQGFRKNKLAFVGRLSMVKRLDLILEGMYKAYSDWYLDIIGDGEIRYDVEGWIKLLGLESMVNILGWQKEPLSYMADAAALVSASDYEGFMITGAEALAMGKPVITTPTQGPSEYITDSVNGFFFNFDDSDGLAAILDDIDSGKRILPSSDVCKDSVSRYLSENYFHNLEQILRSVVKS